MKKLFLLAAITTFMSVSCTKDRTCTCTDSFGNTDKVTLVGVTKAQAKSNCVSYKDSNGDKTDCKLN